MTADPELLVELEDFALELAHTAGGIAKANFRKALPVENKDPHGFDPVTSADRAIESVLRAAIEQRYPRHGIVAEEGGDRAGDSDYVWYIDPIDGTKAFMMGTPLWGTLIGVTQNDLPWFGLMCQPVLEEIFFGSPGGSWLIDAHGRSRLRARRCTRLERAILASTHPSMFDAAAREAYDELAARCLLQRWGGDCYNYAMLAAGFIDLVVEAELKPYDIVPLIPVLEGAGCVVTDWEGRVPINGGRVVAAATAELHAAALKILGASAVPSE